MKTNSQILPVILCGGSGTRLWPLSRKSYPKQFVPLINDQSLFELTVERLSAFSNQIITVANETHRFMITEALGRVGASGLLMLEPEAKNTAAAMALAALKDHKEGDDTCLLFCPADHYIPSTQQFQSTIEKGVEAALSGAIVTFGVVPSFPSTAYGYIEKGAVNEDGSFQVMRFIEKPDEQIAQELLLKNDVLWNAGIFLCTRKTLIEALRLHAPEILKACELAVQKMTSECFSEYIEFFRPDADAFARSPSNSIDYAVMEAHKSIAVVPFDGQWSDVGSWNVVANLTEPDQDQNRIEGEGLALEATKTFIYAPSRPVVALGTDDLLIIDTPDAVLVAARDYAEKVKDVVALLESRQYSQVDSHRKVYRPWGWYDQVDVGDRFQVKRIGVKPGGMLSLQKHHHRAEHWVVVKGTAEVTRGDDVFLLSENQSTYISIGEVHRLKNPGKIELEMIEIQSGRYLGEDDIVRLDDTYGRIENGD